MDTQPDESAALDLDAIERDLADVEVALARLDAGSYWTDWTCPILLISACSWPASLHGGSVP